VHCGGHRAFFICLIVSLSVACSSKPNPAPFTFAFQNVDGPEVTVEAGPDNSSFVLACGDSRQTLVSELPFHIKITDDADMQVLLEQTIDQHIDGVFIRRDSALIDTGDYHGPGPMGCGP
jgi:hypothetical protein